jgi:hypothetical protein
MSSLQYEMCQNISGMIPHSFFTFFNNFWTTCKNFHNKN